MKILALVLLFPCFSLLSQERSSEPSVSIISQLRCGSDRFAVLQVSNLSVHDSVFLPLSPLYRQGYTVHDIRLEVKENGQWHFVGRGADIPSSGIRELRPGERFLDLIQLPTRERGATLSALPMRIVVPYKVEASYQQVRSKDFKTDVLPLKNDATCPIALNVK
jgi:hypothetical protein